MIAQRMKDLRKTLGLTQTEFARLSGNTRDRISNIEYARVAPKEVFLNHICEIFNVNPDWLLKGEGNMFKDIEPASAKELIEVMEIFKELNPIFKTYALSQLKGLLKVQQDMKKDDIKL